MKNCKMTKNRIIDKYKIKKIKLLPEGTQKNGTKLIQIQISVIKI